MWAPDEGAPVPRAVHGAVTCDACGVRTDFGQLDRGLDLHATARRYGFSMGERQLCPRCAKPPGEAPQEPIQLPLL